MNALEVGAGPFWVDAVEKCCGIVGFAIGGCFRLIPSWTSDPPRQAPRQTWPASYAIAARAPLVGGGCLPLIPSGTPTPHRQAPRQAGQASYAIAARAPLVGGPSRRSAIV